MASPLDLQPDAAAGKDTGLIAGVPNCNSGVGTVFNAATGQTALIAFDVSSIPSGATITSVTLSLRHSYYGAAATLSCYKVLRAWIEGTGAGAGGSAPNGEPSWTHYSRTAGSWSTAGCKGSGTDRAASASATFSINSTINDWHTLSGAGMIADVQAWVNGAANNGWCMWTDSASGNSFCSSDNATAANRPKLYVEYAPPAAGPAALQAVNGLAKALVRTRNGLAIASIKTWNGLA